MRYIDSIGHGEGRYLRALPEEHGGHAQESSAQAEPVSVIIPAVNAAATITTLVRSLRKDPRVSEILVVDDGSIDGTPELAERAGASVMMSSYLGAGASMEDGLRSTHGDVILFLDGDLRGVHTDLVETMVGPIMTERADLVKARSARVHERPSMVATRPLLSLFFPELARFAQPLDRIVAARRSLFTGIRLERDHGVDLGLLIDAVLKGAKVVEVDVAPFDHDGPPAEALDEIAGQVTRVILDRAWRNDRLSINQVREMQETERRARADILPPACRTGNEQRYALFDMDGVVLEGRFVVDLAERVGAEHELARFLDNQGIPDGERARLIAALFAGVSKDIFEDVARSTPLTGGAVETIVALRQAGYRVGIVSEGFQIAADIVRCRVFADFSVAHLLRFRNGICTGELELSPLMIDSEGCPQHDCCKANVLRHLAATAGLDPEHTLAVGDGLSDVCMLRQAGISVAFRPKSRLVARAAAHTLERSLRAVVHLPDPGRLPEAIGQCPGPETSSPGHRESAGEVVQLAPASHRRKAPRTPTRRAGSPLTMRGPGRPQPISGPAPP